MSDITEIKWALESRALEVVEHLLPRGVLEGQEWCAGSVGGEPGHSLKVRVKGPKAGTWADFAATGESGDLIDLWQAVKHLSLIEALGDIRQWLGMESPRFEKRAKTYRRPDNKLKGGEARSAVLEYLTAERKISRGAIRAYRVGEDDRTIVLPSFLPDGELALVKYLRIDRTPSGKKITCVEPDCEPVLFGWQAIDPEAREVTITEGEVDALSAWDYGWPALSVPFGGGAGNKQAWIESEYERLLRFEVIYLALDMDGEGKAAAEEIANRLGRHRCRQVILPRKDLNECHKAGTDAKEIRRCFEAARSLDPPELVRAGAFADAVVNLFWPSNDREPGYRLPWSKVGDRLVFRPAELTLWTGATGAGKSQVLSHALVGMGEQGARVCIASLEMSPAQVIRRMVKQAGNVDRPTEPYIREIVDWLDSWLWVFCVTGKSTTSRLIQVFEYARCRYGCDVFGIDSLMRLGIGSEDYEGQERAVFELVSWAVAKAVHVHLVAHARKADRAVKYAIPEAEDVKGTSEIAANSANIIGVWRNRKLEDDVRTATENASRGDAEAGLQLQTLTQQPPVLVNVAKQRNGDWEGKFGLWFSPQTYQYRGAQDDRLGRKFVRSGAGPVVDAA
jgi:twinkle protein